MRAHTKALLEWLRADPTLAPMVFDGIVDGKAPPRYVIVFAQTGDHEVIALAGPQVETTIWHTIHCIGTIPSEAQWLAGVVSRRLVNARIPVEGYSSSRVRHESGDPMRLDSSVPPAVYFLADDYAWDSQGNGA